MSNSWGTTDAGAFGSRKTQAAQQSSRELHSQRRATRHTNKQRFNAMRNQGRFDRSAKKFLKSTRPTKVDLSDYVNKTHKFDTGVNSELDKDLDGKAWEIHKSALLQEQQISELLQANKNGSAGVPPGPKEDNKLRVYFESFNSLQLFGPDDKRRKLRKQNTKYQPDIIAGTEHGANIDMVPPSNRFHDILATTTRRSITAHNVHERFERSVPGGVGMFAVGRMANFVIDQDKDPTGLGRWASFKVGTGSKNTWFMVAYNPIQPSKKELKRARRKRSKVWEQHSRYFRRRDDHRNPREIWTIQVVAQIKKWALAGDDVVLMTDYNDCVYTGDLPKRLSHPDIRMKCQFQSYTGEQAPFSHRSGSESTKPVCCIYATPGIVCTNAYQSSHDEGIGDHRYHICDFESTSVIGEDFPHLVRASGRKLTSNVTMKRRRYNKRLTKLSKSHKMAVRINKLEQDHDSMTNEEFDRTFNNWDEEYTDYMKSAENYCAVQQSDNMEWSPTVALWWRRRHITSDVIKFANGKISDVRNLKERCLKNRVADPTITTLNQAKINHAAVLERIENLRPIAPQLRADHLGQCLNLAMEREDKVAVEDIKKMLKKEHSKRQWTPCALLKNKPRSSPPVAVKIPNEYGEYIKFATKDDLNEQVGTALEKRYKLSRIAPICDSTLGRQLGHLALNEVADSILDGTIDFPEDTERYTRLLLEEAPFIFSKAVEGHMHQFLRSDDFQEWWKTADESIQSSYSQLHFSHYKCAAHDDYLSVIQTAKMNLALKTGVPLNRWKKSLTVLLEKKFGQIYIEKLRAICLFEADFNWISKILFAKRMMTNARAMGIHPPEHFAVAGTDPNDAVMVSVLSHDIHRTLHVTFSESSADFGDCYDCVAHPICSIGLQAFGLERNTVKLFLETLEIMDFFLRSGFGVSDEAWGGTSDDPCYGLGQGAGWAPASFSATSTLNVNAYKRLGHGVTYTSAISRRTFYLAAILYVDDANLLEVADPSITDEAFIRQVQDAVYDWGKLAQALGGYLKQKKSFSYFCAFKFTQGVAKLRKLREWKNTRIVIPQPNGDDVPIDILDPSDSREKLGVWTNPAGIWKKQREEMKDKGLDWTVALRSNHIPPRLAWNYLDHQLKPKMEWGLVAMSDDPAKLEEAYQKVHYQALSPLRVNQHITKEYRMMLPEHQGLGMFNPNIDCLGKKISYCLRNWLRPTTIGNMLQQAYEMFLLDLGFGGDLFNLNYDRYSSLSADGWFKHIWCLCWRFRVQLFFHEDNNFQPIRQGDKTLMDLFCDSEIFNIAELRVLQRYRHYKKARYVSDIVACDGITILPSALTHSEGISKLTYPHERPTKGDHKLWVSALKAISSPRLVLGNRLGKFLRPPPHLDEWYYDSLQDVLYNSINTVTIRYIKIDGGTTRSSSNRYKYQLPVESTPSDLLLATVVRDDNNPSVVRLHSTALPPTKDEVSGFWNVLASYNNDSLWRHMDWSKDPEEWLYDSLCNGTTIVVHDGSFMPKLTPDVCSAAVIICDKESGEWLSCTIAEKSSSADNYRGEILGGVTALLLIKAATTGRVNPDPNLNCHCDNMGVVNHANHPDWTLREKQSQADSLALLKHIISILETKIKYHHVQAHQLKNKTFDQLELVPQKNEICDQNAKSRLVQSFLDDDYITGVLPFEQIRLVINDEKVTSSPTQAIHKFWSYKTARALFHNRKIVHKDHFKLIYWPGMGKVMRDFPRMFRVWVTKHVSHFCGTNRQLNRIDPRIKNKCPSCGKHDEPTSHINRCKDSGRTQLFKESVEEVADWLYSAGTDDTMITLIVRYLKGRGNVTMGSILDNLHDYDPVYKQIAYYQDQLGWDNFMEGRILSLMVDHMRLHYHMSASWRTAEWWAKQLMKRLLSITHKQWLHRNAKVHIKKRDGKTQVEHHEIMKKVRRMLRTDPMELLERDRHLLLTEDFQYLGQAPSSYREYWVAEMETAIESARRHDNPIMMDHAGNIVYSHGENIGTEPLQFDPPLVDTEGSIRFTRRKKK